MRAIVLVRYVGVAYLGAVALTTLGLSVLVVAATMIEGGGQLARAGAGVATVLKLASLSGLAFSYQILPAAGFLGALVAGTMLARRGELLGVQASGIGMLPIWAGFLTVAVAVSTFGYMLGEWVVPRAIQALELTRAEELQGQSDGVARFYHRELRWFRNGDTVLYLPTSADPDATAFATPTVYEIRDGELLSLTEAVSLRFENDNWWLNDAKRFDVRSGEITEHQALAVDLAMSARDIAEVTGDPRQMRTASVKKLISRRERAGFDVTSHRIELNLRYAYPLNLVWMLVLALPWTLHPDRRRSLAVYLGAGVVVIAVLFVMMYFFRLLALGHRIPVFLGAYGIPVTCLVAIPINAWMYRRYRVRGGLL
ncbi:MAG: LptF/LptG family permease [Myxococcota bacterium]